MTEKTGQELVQEILNDPQAITLDYVLDRNPLAVPNTDAELIRLVKTLRAERTMIDIKQETKDAEED